MKITVNLKGQTVRDGKQVLFAGDIRRYIGSIVSDKYKEIFMWHEHTPSPFIYLKPYKDYFEILTYREEMIDALEHLISRITLNPIIKLNGISLEVDNIKARESNFAKIESGLFRYRTRTPIVIGSSKTEHAIYNSLKDDDEGMKDFASKTILDSVKYQIKEYFGVDFDAIEEATISFSSFSHFTVNYKNSGTFYPAVYCEFVSTYSLPQMLGYKFGLGYGHIVPVREKITSNKKGVK